MRPSARSVRRSPSLKPGQRPPTRSPARPAPTPRSARLDSGAKLAALAATLLAACTPDSPPPPGLARSIDAVFADLDAPGSPGAQVAVIQDGEIVLSHGYGEAQIEHGVPITRRTVFHVASVSKQFTAMAVTMLADRGALSLDDAVQKHLPRVPLFPHRVTVRQMIHHTSGIRDQWQLLAMSGWRLDDVITTEQILGLMERQRELNFEPGSEYLYSNMGYTLLGEVAAAAGGMPFVDFTASEIFGPLGMTRTHFHDDHRHVVPNRAYSYAPASREDGDGADDDESRDGSASQSDSPRFSKAVLSYANAGATSLFTTAEDLARWLDNFRHQTVGGPEVMAAMQERGVLDNGDTISYAHGLIVGEHRGLRTVGHSGGDAGFRTQATWYPEATTGVVVLSNVANGNPGGRARQVAEVVLAELFPEAPEEPGDEGPPPASPTATAPEAAPLLAPGAAAQYEGSYYSPELDAIYHLRAADRAGDGATDAALVLRHVRHGEIALRPRPAPDPAPRAEPAPAQQPAAPAQDAAVLPAIDPPASAPDDFVADAWFMRNVRFVRDDAGTVTGMRVGGGRVRNLLFARLAGEYGGRGGGPDGSPTPANALRAGGSPLPGDELFPTPADTAALLADPPFAIPDRPFATPSGPHAIGMTEYRWVDASRPERFTRDPADRRSVAARIWYPMDEAAEPVDESQPANQSQPVDPAAPTAPYAPDLAEFGANQEFAGVTHVRTNAILDAPAARGPFPVLVYNHGGGWSRFTGTFTTEEMASHGYVVVSAGHNGFNRTQFLPDGSSVIPDTLELPAPTGEDLYAESMATFAFLDEHHFPEWVADAAFALDQLEALNRGEGGEGAGGAGASGAGIVGTAGHRGMGDAPDFAGTLDLDRVGMYGWSFGGATAIEMSAVDERVKAAIDHDGQLFGTAPGSGTTRPFMLMHGGTVPDPPPASDPEQAAAQAEAMARLMAYVAETDSRLKAASDGEWHDITIAGTNHGSFSDLVLFFPGSSPDIRPARGHRIVNALTLAFFDRYLKGADAPLLDDPEAEFPEVSAERSRP